MSSCLNGKSKSTFILVFLFLFISSASRAYVYGGTVPVVEEAFQSYMQFAPDIVFDSDDYLHAVWVDSRFSYKYIFNRMGVNGEFGGSSQRADFANGCDSIDCNENFPYLIFRTEGPNKILNVLYRSDEPPPLRLSEFDFASWYEVSGPSLIGSPTSDYSVACYGSNVYVAYLSPTGISFQRYTGSSTWASDTYYISPGPNNTFYDVDIAVDSDGYLYAAFTYQQDSPSFEQKTVICRSQDIANLTTGFTELRDVVAVSTNGYDRMNSLAVSGLYPSSLLVSVAFIDDSLGPKQVRCVSESNFDWTSTTPPAMYLNGTWTIVSSSIALNPQDPDIKIDSSNRIHVVWSDERAGTGLNKIYVANSEDSGATFLNEYLISNPDPLCTAIMPRIATSAISDSLAIVFEEWDGYYNKIKVTWNATGFNDNCDDPSFPGWDTHSGVEVELNPPDHSGNPAYKFTGSKSRGLLEKDYGTTKMTGSIDFWFYDSGSTVDGEDFSVAVYGDDGTDAGVYRMLGVRNAIRADEYALNVDGTWMLTGRSRIADWHHVSIMVDFNGIRIYLDPENYSDPINLLTLDPNRSFFTNFSRIAFLGNGSIGTEYFIDDVSIVANPINATIDVPASNYWGLMLALITISAFIFIRKF